MFFSLRNPGLHQKLQPRHVVLPCRLDGNENVLQYQQVLTSVSRDPASVFLHHMPLILPTFSLVRRLLPCHADDQPGGRFCTLQVVPCWRDARAAGKVRWPRPDLGSGSRPVHLLRRGFECGDEQEEETAERQGEEEADLADAD